jgi:hypothetical protein
MSAEGYSTQKRSVRDVHGVEPGRVHDHSMATNAAYEHIMEHAAARA